LARSLVEAGAVVDLLAFGDRSSAVFSDPARAMFGSVRVVDRPIRPTGRRLLDFVSGQADLATRLRSVPFADAFAEMVAARQYDAIQFEGFEVAHVALGPDALRAEAWQRAPWSGADCRTPILVFDDHNAEFDLQRSAASVDLASLVRWPRGIYSLVQARRLRRREGLYAAAADVIVTVSDEDASLLRGIVPGLAPIVVPNGIDVASFGSPVLASAPTLLFAGKLDYRPNVDAAVWFTRNILPAVRAVVPDVRLVLAGRDPAPAVRALGSPGVEVTGYLTEAEMRARLASAWVAVVPVRMGSGTRFKVLEAMAAGVPVVATTFGAAGSGIIDGVHGRLADDAGSFAGAVIDLLGDRSERGRVAAAARGLAAVRHDWGIIVPRLVDAYVRALTPAATAPSVIATVRNEASTVADLIGGVATQTLVAGSLVLVDGGSTDATVSVAREAAADSAFPVDIHLEPGANIAAGRNVAVERSGAQVLAAIDAGTVLHPEWLARLAGVLERSPDVDVASGFFVGAPRSPWERALSATTLPAVEDIDPARFQPSSRSVAFRRAALDTVKGYPAWLDYGEDLVLDMAMRRAGAIFRFVPRAVVRFRPRSTVQAFFVQYYRYARGDGKAGLFASRHAVRYGAYVCGVLLALAIKRNRLRLTSAGLLAIGAVGYLNRPVARLLSHSQSTSEAVTALPWVPVVRVVGDVAKMIGYPVGVWWRWSRGELPHDRRLGGTP
jgi:glycosyltransferase involved in cell wall biosynthesis